MKKTLLLILSVLLAAVLLLFAFGKIKLDILHTVDGGRVWQHLSAADQADDSASVLAPDGTVSADFSSHLPILLIEPDGGLISDLRNEGEVSEASHYGDNVNPYSEMTLRVYAGNGLNSLTSEPTQTLEGKIKIRGGSTSNGKKQYRMKLLDAFGDGVKAPLLGMSAGDEWILNGMDSDPTCLRSYLAYNLAGELNLDSPDVRYCEVVLRDGDDLRYLGLYLLTEPVERGEGRVALKGKKNLVGAYSYIVRRDKSDTDSVVLSTWASQQAGLTGFIGDVSTDQTVLTLIYPKGKKLTSDAIAYVTSDLSKIEQRLASEDISTFASFSGILNTDSFIDYFLLNEYLMNRSAGTTSTYMYRDIGSKLTIGPVWGFNDAASHAEDTDLFRMDTAPFYADLLKNSRFQDLLQKRLSELRRDTLSDGRILSLLEETQNYLGTALDRDRKLRAISAEDYTLAVEEFSGRLLSRGKWLDQHLTDLRSVIVTDPAATVRRFAIVFLTGGFLLVAGLFSIRLKTGRSPLHRKAKNHEKNH